MDQRNLNFFGNYLKEKGVISQEELADAIAFQEESNRRIGELARERGYLSKEQTETIFQEQKRVDQPFGTIALKHRYLTRSQLDALLFAQTVFSTHQGEALLVKGYISPEQFSEELEAFRLKQVQREEQLNAFFSGLPEKEILQAVVSAANRAYIRFGGRELKLDSICSPTDSLYEIRFVVTVQTQEKGTITASFHLGQNLVEELLQVFGRSGMASGGNGLTTLQDFFAIVVRYLQLALAELGLTVLQGDVSGGRLDEAVAVSNIHGVVVQLVTPVGPIMLHAEVQSAQDKAPCAEV